MTTFLAKRLFSLLVTLLVASLIIFLLLGILPGDPALIILGVGAQEDTLAALRTEMGLDLSAPERYFRWIIGILQGDFGRSYTYDTPVSELILERLSLSLPLALLAISLSTLLAIPFGVFAAANHKRFADTGIMGFAQLGVAVPNFWFAILLILFFSVKLGWFS
ncbi:MAG: ABC transporter permease, partial [Deltaproteobacteria bacterium]|nr:ABC transporter permease [Deltaproteobacteria bacterium]